MNQSITVARHCVPQDPITNLSPLQMDLLHHPAQLRIADAPTGSGKSYAFQQGMLENDARVLFIVPTRRLAQNLWRGLMENLERAGWTAEKCHNKVSLWSSDASAQLRQDGIKEIGPRRIREISRLDMTRQGGEMIIAIPEVVSRLLLRPYLQQGQSKDGIFDILANFDHIVFDEFHTIDARGFGLAAVFAKLAATGEGRAKISFLSATPIAIQPVLENLQVPDIVTLSETTSTTGRAVHGDVTLSLWETDTMVALLDQHRDLIANELAQQRQVVVIYNKLYELQCQVPQLEALVKQIGIAPQDCLLLNSIDDTRPEVENPGQFAVGRFQAPEKFKILIATASIEVGVTFKARIVLMEPGFQPLNFLQRYGRAARGDVSGQVLVRLDEKLENNNPWLRRLKKWITEQQRVQIEDLTELLAKGTKEAFKHVPVDKSRYFGALPNRATFTAGLYWYLLSKHPSNKGHRRDRLLKKKNQPEQARWIAKRLNEVRAMQEDLLLGASAKAWCDGFEAQAHILRDIGQTIRIISDSGEVREVREIWLWRYTNILERGVWSVGEDGREEVHYLGDWQVLEEKTYVPEIIEAKFPHTQNVAFLEVKSDLVNSWCKALKEQFITDAWHKFPQAGEAAIALVRRTGLIVVAETIAGLDASGGVL